MGRLWGDGSVDWAKVEFENWHGYWETCGGDGAEGVGDQEEGGGICRDQEEGDLRLRKWQGEWWTLIFEIEKRQTVEIGFKIAKRVLWCLLWVNNLSLIGFLIL